MPEPEDGLGELEESLGAPEEAIGEPKRYRRKIPLPPKTIAGLRLNVEAAEQGRYWEILPLDVRKQDRGEYEYPVPVATGELARIAAIVLPQKQARSKNSGAVYIRRCRKRLDKIRHSLKPVAIEAGLAETREAAIKAQGVVDQTVANLEALEAEARRRVDGIVTSLSDLHDKVKQAADLLVDSFLSGNPVNGEPVKQSTVVDLIGKVMTHTARMGGAAIDSTGKEQAEEAVMAEFLEATRKRLAKEAGHGDDPTH